MLKTGAPDTLAGWRPVARQDHLVMSQVGDEVLVYDETTHAIHRLNPTSHAIWSLCDGTRNLGDIGQDVSAALGDEVPAAVVRLALGQLAAANLLAGTPLSVLHQPRQSRRAVLRRLAMAGGVALPVLVSVSAPTAAQTGSCGPVGHACETFRDCCSGLTCPNGGPYCCLPTDSPCSDSSQCCSGMCLTINHRCRGIGGDRAGGDGAVQ